MKLIVSISSNWVLTVINASAAITLLLLLIINNNNNNNNSNNNNNNNNKTKMLKSCQFPIAWFQTMND